MSTLGMHRRPFEGRHLVIYGEAGNRYVLLLEKFFYVQYLLIASTG